MTESTLWEEGVGQLDVCRVLAAGRARVVWRHGAPLGDLDTHGAVWAPGAGDGQWQSIRGQRSVKSDPLEVRSRKRLRATDQTTPYPKLVPGLGLTLSNLSSPNKYLYDLTLQMLLKSFLDDFYQAQVLVHVR